MASVGIGCLVQVVPVGEYEYQTRSLLSPATIKSWKPSPFRSAVAFIHGSVGLVGSTTKRLNTTLRRHRSSSGSTRNRIEEDEAFLRRPREGRFRSKGQKASKGIGSPS